jgi:hypothetical protein
MKFNKISGCWAIVNYNFILYCLILKFLGFDFALFENFTAEFWTLFNFRNFSHNLKAMAKVKMSISQLLTSYYLKFVTDFKCQNNPRRFLIVCLLTLTVLKSANFESIRWVKISQNLTRRNLILMWTFSSV